MTQPAWVQAAIDSTQTTASASHAAMTAALGAVAQEADRCGLLCGSTHILVVVHTEARLMLKQIILDWDSVLAPGAACAS